MEKMGRKIWEMIFWIAVTQLSVAIGEDVSFQYDSCYSESITMTATYTGSGTVTVVQWYYSGKTGNNLFVVPSTCTIAGGSAPSGYPDASQMSFECPSTNPGLPINTFKLTVTGLQGEALKNSWGATFSLTTGSSDFVESSFSICTGTTSDCGCPSLNRCDFSKGQCGGCWFGIAIAILAGIAGIVFMILKFVVGVNFPCGNRHQS